MGQIPVNPGCGGGVRLIVFADYACPYCYLAETQVAQLRASGVVETERAAYELRPAGTPLLDPDEPWLLEGWRRSVAPIAESLGVSMQRPTLMTRTRKAHEAVAFARSRAKDVALHEAIYRAYWQEGRDIGRIDVLSELGAEVGLDPVELRIALDVDQWTERVEEDQALARQLGLSGVPAYLLLIERTGDGPQVAADLRVGLQRHDELTGWVRGHDVREDDGRADS